MASKDIKVMKLVPGLAGRGRPRAVLAACFYLYCSILVWRAHRVVGFLGGSGAQRASSLLALAVAALLYLMAVRGCPAFSRLLLGGNWKLRQKGGAVVGSVVLSIFLISALLAPILAPYDPNAPVFPKYSPPSLSHPMGTDRLGRDVLSRVLYGGRVSLIVGVGAVLVAGLVGVMVGALAGYLGGAVDEVAMRIADGFFSFPRLLLVLLLVAFFRPSLLLLTLAIAFTGWMGIARVVRAEVLSLKEREFVQAAMATGLKGRRIIARHLLPNALGPVIVAATLQVGAVVLVETTLSFLGLGVKPPTPSWGAMVYEGRAALLSAWWVAGSSGSAIVALVMAVNLVGDGLRDALGLRPQG